MMLKYLLSIILVSVFMVACSPIKMPPVKTYALSGWKKMGSPGKPKTKLTILVTTPTAAPGYQTSSMIYMLSPYELDAYANNKWVASPAQMLMPIFVEAIRQTGYFYAIVSPPFSGVTNLRLDTQILKMQQEFLLPISRVRLTVQASLLSNISNRVVATRRFEVVMTSPQNNAYSGVLAANRAAKRIAREVAKFVVSSAKRLPKSETKYPTVSTNTQPKYSNTAQYPVKHPIQLRHLLNVKKHSPIRQYHNVKE